MNLLDLQQDPAQFRRSLQIDCDGSSRRFSEVVDPWQEDDFRALDPAWKVVVGQPEEGRPVRMRAWLERGRGHSKTHDLAVMATWAMFASRRPLRGYAAAADQDQARLLRDSIDRLLRLNSWLRSILRINRYEIVNTRTGSVLEILSADVASSYGLTPDFIVADEVVHWRNRDLWDSLLSASAKRRNCLLVAITNAGFRDSWQWEMREAVRCSGEWYFSRLNGPQASWITLPRLDEQRRLLPTIAYRRLWLNEWTSGSGDALEPDDIDAAVVLPGPQRPALGWSYVAGLDLGLKRDASALVVLGRHVGFFEEREKPKRIPPRVMALIDAGVLEAPDVEYDEFYEEGTGKLLVARIELWKPSRGRVNLEVVEETIVDLDRLFGLECVGYDPWQAEYLGQRLSAGGVRTEPVTFTPGNLQAMAQAMLEAFGNRNISLYDHPQLLADLRALQVTEKGYGIRLESPRGPNGHGDCATALAISLLVSKNNFSVSAGPFIMNHDLIAY